MHPIISRFKESLEFKEVFLRKKILIVTTVAETLRSILDGQPLYLSNFFGVTLASSDEDILKKVAERERVDYLHVSMKRGISPFFDIVSIVKMCWVIKRSKPDIIHSYTPKAGLVAACAGFIMRVPVRVHTFTGLIFPTSRGLRKSVLIFADRLICRLCTVIIPEGQGVRSDLIECNIIRNPHPVIGRGNIAGVDLDFFDPFSLSVIDKCNSLKKDLCLEGYIVFCYIGRMNKDKGLSELLSAFTRLEREVKVKLIIVGGLDRESPISATDSQIIDSNSNICFFGFQSDIRPHLSASHALILPSYREGFPNVLLQAGAMCKPCIATNVNGSNEIIQNGKNGFLVPPKNSNQLFGAMRNFCNLPVQQVDEMAHFARDNIVKNFERKKYLNLLRTFYLSLLRE
jgi:glycosyltransferase involved in cell wall biosynthesis